MMEKTVTYNTYLMDADLTYGYPNPTYGENVIFRIQVGQAEKIEINILFLLFKLRKIKLEEVDSTCSELR